MKCISWTAIAHGFTYRPHVYCSCLFLIFVLDMFLPIVTGRYTSDADGANKHRSANLPSAMLVTIRTADNNSINIHLERNDNLHRVIPGFYVAGRNITRIATDTKVNLEAYISRDLTASFTVACVWVGSACIREFAGEYLYKGIDYEIRPSLVLNSGTGQQGKPQPLHRVLKRSLRDNNANGDIGEVVEISYRIKRQSDEREGTTKKPKYEKEAPLKCIKVVVISDYPIYQRFINLAKSDVHNFEYLYMRHLFQIMNGVDVRYRKIQTPHIKMCVKMVAYYLATTSDTLWDKDITPGSDVKALEVLRSYANTYRNILLGKEGSPLMPIYDHSVLLSGHDITHHGKKSTLGFAYIATMCAYWSVSIVEDRGDMMTTMWIVAHEIGHSLGAEHDGRGNKCLTQDQNVMAKQIVAQTPSNAANHYSFSPCSLKYFRSFVRTMEKNGKNACLNCTEPFEYQGNEWDVYRLDLPGYQYNPDQQCRFIHGEASYLARDAIAQTSLLCSIMPCYNPNKPLSYSIKQALDGTPCDTRKACLHGKCVNNYKVTSFDPDCPYGEQAGMVDEERKLYCNDSSEVLCTDTTIWANRIFAKRCCQSCKKFKRDTECKDRDNPRPGFTCSDLKHSCHYKEIRDVCCQTCATSCVDVPKPSYPDVTCANLARYCHYSHIRRKCCNTCKRTTACVDQRVLYRGSKRVTCESQGSQCNEESVQKWCCASCWKTDTSHGQRSRPRRRITGYLDVRPIPQSADMPSYRYTGDERVNTHDVPDMRINDNPLIEPEGRESYVI